MELTQELVREFFDYRDADGKLIHKKARTGVAVGTEAGWVSRQGYRDARVLTKCYREHRIIFLYHHGYLPKMVDHINGVKTDNRIENLRECTRGQNKANSKGSAASGYKGVYKHGIKWTVLLSFNRKTRYFGLYDNIETAAQVAEAAREHYHGEFANHEHKGSINEDLSYT